MRGRTGVSRVWCSDFGYLACCTGCCDDAEDFLLEVLAVNRKNLFAPLACALLVFSMLGCGVTDHCSPLRCQTRTRSRPRATVSSCIPTGRCKCMYGEPTAAGSKFFSTGITRPFRSQARPMEPWLRVRQPERYAAADRAVEFRRTAYARRSRCLLLCECRAATATSPAFEYGHLVHGLHLFSLRVGY